MDIQTPVMHYLQGFSLNLKQTKNLMAMLFGFYANSMTVFAKPF